MSSRMLQTIVITVLAVGVVAAQGVERAQSQSAATMFESARKLETVDGDLKGAIRQYEAIVKQYPNDRATAANALLRMADCYHRLGDQQEAGKHYDRILRDFSDHKAAAAAARAQLGAATPRTKVFRPVWTGPAVGGGNVSGDGRYIPFANPDTGDLMVRDLASGRESRLTDVPEDRQWKDFVSDAAISRDGALVAYSWYIDGSRNQLRVADRVPGEGSAQRILLDSPEIGYVTPFDWSPRRDWIAVQVKRVDGSAQIGIASAHDGTFRALRSVDWRGTTRMSVSPDGFWILYDLPSSEEKRQRDVFVIGSDGRQQYQVNARPGYNVAVGWAPDGNAALFATERSGTVAMFSTPLRNGRPQGAPELLEPDMSAFVDGLGVTQSGRLTYIKKVGAINVFTASIDLVSGALLSAPEPMTDSMVPNHPGAMWSPDGRYLAFPSSVRGVNTITIQTADGGQVREVTPRVSRLQFPRWSAEHFMTFQGVDLKGRQGIFLMDVRTGETTRLAGGPESDYLSWPAATPDGGNVVYTRNRSGKFTLVSRSVTTGEELDLFYGVATATSVSPDGKMVAFRTGDAEVSAVMVVPVTGGKPHVVVQAERPMSFGHLAEWLPDGRLLVARWKDRKFDRLIGVSLKGDSTVDLPAALEPLGSFFRVHPDGRRVAFSSGANAFEIWTLDNFLPSPPTQPRHKPE